MEAENTTSTGPSSVNADALNRQLIQLLISDVENLRALYQLYTAESARGQLTILYRRAREYLEQLESFANSILLERDELKQLQEDKAFLEKLIFELTGSFEKAFLERFGKHGHHGRRGEKPDEEEMKKAFNERMEGFGPWGFGRRGFGPESFGGRGGLGPQGFGHQGLGPQSLGPQGFGPGSFGQECFGDFGGDRFGHGGPFGGEHFGGHFGGDPFGDHFGGPGRGGFSRGGRGGGHSRRHGMFC